MRRLVLAVLLLLSSRLDAQTRVPTKLEPSRDQPIDAEATAKIRQ